LAGAPVSPDSPFALLWAAGLYFAPALVGRLLAYFNACSARLRLAAAHTQPPAACVQNQFVYKNDLSAPTTKIKKI